MLCSYWNNPVRPPCCGNTPFTNLCHRLLKWITWRDVMAPKCTRLLNFFNRYREFFMATLQPVICLVEKKENSPFFRIFLQCLLDYRHILKQFFVAVFNARECFQAINKIDKIGNLIFCWWNSAMSVTLLSVYLLKKLLKQLKKKIFSRTMALENLERLLRELEMKTSTPRWVIKIPLQVLSTWFRTGRFILWPEDRKSPCLTFSTGVHVHLGWFWVLVMTF